MHYFIGMEVWQSIYGIFLGQGKYAVEILKRFKMMDCKAITTPMESNLKLLSVSSSELVDARMYCQMIYFLMYRTNMRPDICFVVNTLRHVHLVITQNCTQVVGGTLRGNSKTTLGRYWYFSPREGSLNTNLTKSNDKQYLSIHSFGWNQSHIHWAWSHIQVKDHKDTYTRTIKGKIITSLQSLSLIWVKRKRWENSPSIQSV